MSESRVTAEQLKPMAIEISQIREYFLERAKSIEDGSSHQDTDQKARALALNKKLYRSKLSAERDLQEN